jgi:hypothetical protein
VKPQPEDGGVASSSIKRIAKAPIKSLPATPPRMLNTLTYLVIEDETDGSCASTNKSTSKNSVHTNDLMGTDSNVGRTADPHNMTFPCRLYSVLEDAETKGYESIISWTPMGFKVHDRDAFMRYIAPTCFSITKYKSFLRQLNLYKFQRISRGPERGKTPIIVPRQSEGKKRETVLTFLHDLFVSLLQI